MAPPRPCTSCGIEPKKPGHPRLCAECWILKQPAAVQAAHVATRLAAVPEPLRRARVPEREWPTGRRWCASCQSFARLADCSGSRCRPCASVARHASAIKGDFGITGEEYAALLKAQGGRCAICRQRPRSKRLAVDHDHRLTGRASVRGLCCSSCNHDLLGAAHDSIEILRSAVAYLEDPPARRVLFGSGQGPGGDAA